MIRREQGAYQPPAEPLALYDPLEEEDERSRLPLLIVIALLVVAAFAGVVWLAYNQGVASGRASAPALVQAPTGPVRTAADDTDQSETPYTGLKVYSQPVPPDEEAKNSTLAPQSESVVSPTKEAPSMASASGQASASRSEQPTASAVQAPSTAPAPQTRLVHSTASAAAQVGGASATSGSAVIQIGAYVSEDLAQAAWTRFQTRYADSLGGLGSDIQRVDLGDKGVWYRLRIGPFADRSAATMACDSLKSQGASCFAAAP